MLKNKKRRNEKAVSNLITALANGASELTIAAINNQIEDFDKENNLINAQIDELNNKELIQSQLFVNLNSIEDAITFLKYNFDELSIETKREYISKIIEKVVWDGEEAHIFIKGSTV